jgi:hypothetical protein
MQGTGSLRLELAHPRAAFGVTPSMGQHLRPGKAGSAVFWTIKSRWISAAFFMPAPWL